MPTLTITPDFTIYYIVVGGLPFQHTTSLLPLQPKHLYIWVEKQASVKCLSQGHNRLCTQGSNWQHCNLWVWSSTIELYMILCVWYQNGIKGSSPLFNFMVIIYRYLMVLTSRWLPNWMPLDLKNHVSWYSQVLIWLKWPDNSDFVVYFTNAM